MEATNQKPITDTQKLEQKEHKHSTKENHQTSREETKRRRRRKRKKKQIRIVQRIRKQVTD